MTDRSSTAPSSASRPDAPIRLLLADDHTMLREAVRRAMESAGFIVVAEAADGEEAVRLAGALCPDVILMDVSMPVLDGVEATRQIHHKNPDIHIVMLTMHGDADVITQALSAGAIGYLVKDCSMAEVVDAVRLAADGDTALSTDLASSMLREVKRIAGPSSATAPSTDPVITKREEEVLQLIAEGLSTPEVAASLFISVKTVKNHLASIYAKLDSRDRTQAVIRAVKMGIVHLE